MTYYFQKLIIWQRALELTKIVYQITQNLPKEERYALADQMKRAAVSIMSNIAEGSGRQTNPDKNHFYTIAKGSALELASQLILLKELKYTISLSDFDHCHKLIADITNILYSFTKK